jgi:hypothetical protein
VAAVFDTAGAMFGVNNLSDVDDVAASRNNLGLSTVSATGSYTDLTDVPSTFTPSAHTHTVSEITDAGTAATQDATAFSTPSQAVAFAIIFGS